MDIFEFLSSIQWLQAILFLIGFILVIVEMFNPGLGVPGITGAIILIFGIILMADTPAEAVVLLIIILGILAVALAIIVYLSSKGKISRKVILRDQLNKESGFDGVKDLSYLVGRQGKATSVLRPAGSGVFEGERLDVVADGKFIEKGVDIKIIRVEGRRIVVDDFK